MAIGSMNSGESRVFGANTNSNTTGSSKSDTNSRITSSHQYFNQEANLAKLRVNKYLFTIYNISQKEKLDQFGYFVGNLFQQALRINLSKKFQENCLLLLPNSLEKPYNLVMLRDSTYHTSCQLCAEFMRFFSHWDYHYQTTRCIFIGCIKKKKFHGFQPTIKHGRPFISSIFCIFLLFLSLYFIDIIAK